MNQLTGYVYLQNLCQPGLWQMIANTPLRPPQLHLVTVSRRPISSGHPEVAPRPIVAASHVLARSSRRPSFPQDVAAGAIHPDGASRPRAHHSSGEGEPDGVGYQKPAHPTRSRPPNPFCASVAFGARVRAVVGTLSWRHLDPRIRKPQRTHAWHVEVIQVI